MRRSECIRRKREEGEKEGRRDKAESVFSGLAFGVCTKRSLCYCVKRTEYVVGSKRGFGAETVNKLADYPFRENVNNGLESYDFKVKL